jgi:hypothetical protein
MTPPTDIGASLLARLRNLARERREDVQFVQQRYAAERFLYRLGESAHRDRYVLKGAMLFALWGGSAYRPTRDLDFTGYGESDPDAVLAAFREICTQRVPDDGLTFDPATLTAEPIREEVEYGGLRVKFLAGLGSPARPWTTRSGSTRPTATRGTRCSATGAASPTSPWTRTSST